MPAAASRPRSAPLAITGLGCIAAPGAGLDAQLRALEAGASGLATRDDPALPLAARLPIGRVTAPLPRLPSRTAALALAAARQALDQAGLDRGRRGEVAVVVGTCTGGMPESEAAFLAQGPAAISPCYRRQPPHVVTRAVARRLGLGGAQGTHALACASAAAAIIEAAELVRSGACPAALAIGADALTRVTMAGFTSLQLTDPDGCRPLIAERGGMSLGEGAAALLLEHPDHARRRGATAHASLLGWGLSADAYHLTSPDPDGAHLRRAIGDCLADAGLDAAEVGYVNAHGTGTRDNDQCETAALAALFGAVPCASSKRSYGHTMGAAAAIEAVACCLALARQRLWASAGAAGGTPLGGVEVVAATRPAHLAAACSTTLAFGGINACLAFGGADRCG
jgi:3-oxoacyl-(acyl-carrier-protein) synthase